MSTRLIDSLSSADLVSDAFADAAVIGALLRVEVALAVAQGKLGIIPSAAADAIREAAVAATFDPADLTTRARRAGTPIIPFVETFTAHVRRRDATAAKFVHWGATSQDVADTALILCVDRACEHLQPHAVRLEQRLRALSDEHAGTLMLGRTLLQPAPPITFGLKAAGWCAAVCRGWHRLDRARRDACVLQFGGASGTLAALGSRGPDVARVLASELSLPAPGAPWHTQPDRLASFVGACGVLAGTLGKVARDVALLMQHEVSEVAEAGGGSSTMPQKRNPSNAALVLAAATRAPGQVAAFLSGMMQEHERGVGGWHAEWATVASVVEATGSALIAAADMLEGLRVDPARMRANLDATGGAVFAERAMMLLAPTLGRDAAHSLLGHAADEALKTGRPFSDVLVALPEIRAVLPDAATPTLTDPREYLGAAEAIRRQLLAPTRD